MKVLKVACALALAASSMAAEAVTLTFNGQPANTALTTYSQDGFTVALDTGSYQYSGGFTAVPTTSLFTGYFGSPQTTTSASFNLTAIGGAFTFASLDYYGTAASSVGGRADNQNSVTFTGFLGGTQAFSQVVILGSSPTNDLATISSAFGGAAIDRLNVATQGFSLYLDNLSVGAAPVGGAVPEPASWALMLTGFGLMGGAMRRRQTQVSFS